VLSTLVPHYPALATHLESQVTELRANFVAGDDDAWREMIDAAGRERLWAEIPQGAKDWLELAP
jgi:hypothetical protein